MCSEGGGGLGLVVEDMFAGFPQNKLHPPTPVACKMVGQLSTSLQEVLISGGQMERAPAIPQDVLCGAERLSVLRGSSD